MPVNSSMFRSEDLVAIGFASDSDVYDFSHTSGLTNKLLEVKLADMRNDRTAPQAIVRVVCNEEADDYDQLFVLYLRISSLRAVRIGRRDMLCFGAWIDQPGHFNYPKAGGDISPNLNPEDGVVRGLLGDDGLFGAIQFVTRPR